MECNKNDILKRLRRIEGQVKGIEKMIENDKYCSDILIQISAVRAAINKVGGLVLQNYSKECIKNTLENDMDDKNIEDLIDIIVKFMK